MYVCRERESAPHCKLQVMVADTACMYVCMCVCMYALERESAPHCKLQVMVADTAFRRMGLGKEAVRLMMHYGLVSFAL